MTSNEMKRRLGGVGEMGWDEMRSALFTRFIVSWLCSCLHTFSKVPCLCLGSMDDRVGRGYLKIQVKNLALIS